MCKQLISFLQPCEQIPLGLPGHVSGRPSGWEVNQPDRPASPHDLSTRALKLNVGGGLRATDYGLRASLPRNTGVEEVLSSTRKPAWRMTVQEAFAEIREPSSRRWGSLETSRDLDG